MMDNSIYFEISNLNGTVVKLYIYFGCKDTVSRPSYFKNLLNRLYSIISKSNISTLSGQS